MPRKPTRAPAPVQPYPPDPYADDPWSPFFVIFRPMADWPGYGVDTLGNVWSCWGREGRWGPQWHKLSGSRSGRFSVVLRRDGRSHTRRIYRLVLETFAGPCPAGMEACHRDDDQSNNRLDNLRWDTHRGNCADRLRNGKHRVGGRSPMAKNDEPTIARAKGLLGVGIRAGIVATVCGVEMATVRSVKAGATWGHVAPHLDPDQLRAAREIQDLGTGNNVWLEHAGRRMIVQDWARLLGISGITIRSRLSRGWTVGRALSPRNYKYRDTGQ